jgi:hypothetical protein
LLRLTLLGIGAMASPRYRPAGLLVAVEVCRRALDAGVRRLVFAHIGHPTIRALDRGLRPPFGELAVEGRKYVVR